MSTGKSLVLLSGGMDSAYLLAQEVAAHGPETVSCLGFHYGARHNGRELQAARELARFYRANWIEPCSLGWVGTHYRSALLDPAAQTLQGAPTVVPVRNLSLLCLAAGYADSCGIGRVLIGCNATDAADYPDCRADVLELLRVAVQMATGGRVRIEAPLVALGKTEIVKRGSALGVPWDLTYSCYRGDDPPCGVCGACWERQQAFLNAQLEDERPGHLARRALVQIEPAAAEAGA